MTKRYLLRRGLVSLWLQSQGFLSEYGEMLAQEAARAFPAQANVAMLTDFDASGFELAYKIKGVTRLGINLHSIDEINEQRGPDDRNWIRLIFGKYNGANHWINLDYLSKGVHKDRGNRNFYKVADTLHNSEYIEILNQSYEFSDGTEQTYIEFMKDKRIELNTVMDEIGAERFWNWLKGKLIETFPTRNYNRAIDVPAYVLTPTMEEFQEKLQKSIGKMLQTKVGDIMVSLTEVDDLIDTDDKLEEINDDLLDELLEKPEIQKIDTALKRLIKQL